MAGSGRRNTVSWRTGRGPDCRTGSLLEPHLNDWNRFWNSVTVSKGFKGFFWSYNSYPYPPPTEEVCHWCCRRNWSLILLILCSITMLFWKWLSSIFHNASAIYCIVCGQERQTCRERDKESETETYKERERLNRDWGKHQDTSDFHSSFIGFILSVVSVGKTRNMWANMEKGFDLWED